MTSRDASYPFSVYLKADVPDPPLLRGTQR